MTWPFAGALREGRHRRAPWGRHSTRIQAASAVATLTATWLSTTQLFRRYTGASAVGGANQRGGVRSSDDAVVQVARGASSNGGSKASVYDVLVRRGCAAVRITVSPSRRS